MKDESPSWCDESYQPPNDRALHHCSITGKQANALSTSEPKRPPTEIGAVGNGTHRQPGRALLCGQNDGRAITRHYMSLGAISTIHVVETDLPTPHLAGMEAALDAATAIA